MSVGFVYIAVHSSWLKGSSITLVSRNSTVFLVKIAGEFDCCVYKVGILNKKVKFVLTTCPDEEDVIDEP